MTNNIPVITIDGPSGSGKGSISKLLAESLGWHFLDSGAIYRAFALAVLKSKLPLGEIAALVAIGKNLDFTHEEEGMAAAIRTEECGNMASKIAAIPEIREVLVECQKAFCKPPGLVADGRDMGTVIFPEARLKIFLTADINERARRRWLQLQDQSINATLDTVLGDLAARDQRDSARTTAPLKPDPAAMIVDTTKLGVNEVLQQILAHVTTMHF